MRACMSMIVKTVYQQWSNPRSNVNRRTYRTQTPISQKIGLFLFFPFSLFPFFPFSLFPFFPFSLFPFFPFSQFSQSENWEILEMNVSSLDISNESVVGLGEKNYSIKIYLQHYITPCGLSFSTLPAVISALDRQNSVRLYQF